MTYGDQAFIFGDPKGFPKETKTQLEDMVRRKLFYFGDQKTPQAQFETFMKLAGPYWMSCVTKNEAVNILDPDHYRTYLVAGRGEASTGGPIRSTTEAKMARKARPVYQLKITLLRLGVPPIAWTV